MIDDKDSTNSSLRYILWKALHEYSTDELLKLLEDNDVIVRTSAAKQLHLRSEENIFHSVSHLCSNTQDDYKREIGAFVLGQLGTPIFPYKNKSVGILMRLLDDSSSDVRSAAVSAIGHLGAEEYFNDQNILEKIIKLSNDNNDDVRVCCAYSLASFIKSERVVNTLKRLLKDPSNDVREWAKLSIELISTRDKINRSKVKSTKNI